MIIVKVIIALYSILTIVATIADIKENTFNLLHPLYFLCCIILLIATYKNNPVLLAIGLVGLMGSALLTGIIANNTHLSHHIIRFVISSILLVLFIKLKN